MFVEITQFCFKKVWDENKMKAFKSAGMSQRTAHLLGQPIGMEIKPIGDKKVIKNINQFTDIKNFQMPDDDWVDKDEVQKYFQLWLCKDCLPNLGTNTVPWHLRFILVRKDELRRQFKKYNLGALPLDEHTEW